MKMVGSVWLVIFQMLRCGKLIWFVFLFFPEHKSNEKKKKEENTKKKQSKDEGKKKKK